MGTHQARPELRKDKENTAPTHQSFGVYIEALIGFTHSVQVISITHHTLKATSLKMAPAVGVVNGTNIGQRKERDRTFNCPGPAYRAIRCHVL